MENDKAQLIQSYERGDNKHSVFMLDKDLKYKKTLIDSRDGLDKPAAIARLNNKMWIADGNKIWIFNFANT